MIARSILCNVRGGTPEIRRATRQSVFGCVADRLGGCIRDASLIQVTVFVGVLDLRNGGVTHGTVAAGLLALGDSAGLVYVDASPCPH